MRTSDGHIRDDELAKVIKEALKGKKVHDVKILVQSCYGGGLLDDIGRVLNDLGVSWVGGSAAGANQQATGPDSARVAGTNVGNYWTNELRRGLEKGKKVAEAIDSADEETPLEKGVRVSGNQGDTITWDGAKSHHAVLFAGVPGGNSDLNDLSGMERRLKNAWEGQESSIEVKKGGSKQDLVDAINKQAAKLNADEQLVIYITGEGDTGIDLGELLGGSLPGYPPILIPPGITILLSLDDGWRTGLSEQARAYSAGERWTAPAPYLKLTGGGTLSQDLDSSWDVYYGDTELTLPTSVEPGQDVLIPVPWDVIGVGNDTIRFDAVDPDRQLQVAELELSSGPVATISTTLMVGGASELLASGPDSTARPADGSGPAAWLYAALAGGAAAALAAIVAGGWYARRRIRP